jgi:hypothetical protein
MRDAATVRIAHGRQGTKRRAGALLGTAAEQDHAGHPTAADESRDHHMSAPSAR